MIIWINGTYGVGKSSVAKEVKKQIKDKDVAILDPDELFQNMGAEILYDLICKGDGLLPQNNKTFLKRLKEELRGYVYSNAICIVPMALTTRESLEMLEECIFHKCNAFFHFILDADKSLIVERIKSDLERPQKDLALYELNANIDFLNKNFIEAIRINTNRRNIEDIANDIVNRIEI